MFAYADSTSEPECPKAVNVLLHEKSISSVALWRQKILVLMIAWDGRAYVNFCVTAQIRAKP